MARQEGRGEGEKRRLTCYTVVDFGAGDKWPQLCRVSGRLQNGNEAARRSMAGSREIW